MRTYGIDCLGNRVFLRIIKLRLRRADHWPTIADPLSAMQCGSVHEHAEVAVGGILNFGDPEKATQKYRPRPVDDIVTGQQEKSHKGRKRQRHAPEQGASGEQQAKNPYVVALADADLRDRSDD